MNDLSIYKHQNFGNRLGFGSRPALLLIDFVNGFVDPAVFGGGNIADAVAATRPVLAAARSAGLPVAHTRIVYADDGSDASVFTDKVPGLLALTESAPNGQIVDDLAPEPGELIVRKRNASAFSGTGFETWLARHGIDTLLVTGCTTSGSVRASVVDTCSANVRPLVLTDCVGDRAIGPHDANLFDMGQKYADLVSSQDVLGHLQRLAA